MTVLKLVKATKPVRQHGFRTYSFDRKLNEGVIALSWIRERRGWFDRKRDLWTLGPVRGHAKKCCITGKMIERGEEAWRPVTFGNNRMDRISREGMRNLEKLADKQ